MKALKQKNNRDLRLSNCATKDCTKKRKPKKTLCSACEKRKYRERNPIRAAWQGLITRSKRRGILLEMTFDEFHKFCMETSYHLKLGNAAGDMTIDRIDQSKGYSADNIQIASRTINAYKSVIEMQSHRNYSELTLQNAHRAIKGVRIPLHFDPQEYPF